MTAHRAARLGLAVWLLAALLLTLRPAHPSLGQEVVDNLVLFRTFGIYFGNLDSPFWVGQLAGNLLLFVPFGLLGPIALRGLDGWIQIALGSLVISLLIEAAQLWIPNRSADVDDVVLNVVSALLGYAILSIVRLSRPGHPVAEPD